MPCPYGVDIPGIFTHHNKCLNEGEIATNSQDDNYKKARRKYLINYDRRVEPLLQANHCIGCGKCVEHCPQNIKIPKELRHIDEYVESLKQGKL
jgi:predicted aldo/keto reductase-like oxidoreductase